MLPDEIRPLGFDTHDKESWDEYCLRQQLPIDEGVRQFYRQVVYDHFEHFNHHFPDFELENYDISIEFLSALEVRDKVRFLLNEAPDFWREQFDQFERQKDVHYVMYREMKANLTPPFPPVLIEASLLVDRQWRVYGRPFHLVEGTHRVSYLRRMLDKGMIRPDGRHSFVILRPKAKPAL